MLSLISQQSAQQVFQATEEVSVTLRLMRWINYASVMLVVVVALLSYRYLYQKLVTPLLSITAALTSLSHDKNLEVVLPNASNDELGQVVNALKKLIADGGWYDAVRGYFGNDAKLYSWWSYRARDWAASDRGRRLDHIWVSHDLADAVQEVSIHRDLRSVEKPSDHVPVVITI